MAKQYQEALSGREIQVDGGEPDWFNPRHIASLAIHDHGSDAANHLRRSADANAKWKSHDKNQVAALREAARLIDGDDKLPDVTYIQTAGNLYKHDLPDEDIARYLDWDAPLSEQLDKVPEDVLSSLGLRPDDRYAKGGRAEYVREKLNLTGGQMYNRIVGELGSDKAASEALARAGIPGLKYYDGMSRGIIGGPTRPGYQRAFDDAVKKVSDIKEKIASGASDDPRNPLEFQLKKAESEVRKARFELDQLDANATRNYVTWDQDVLDRMKLLERNGEPMGLLDKPSESVTLGANRGGKSSGLLGLSAAGGESGATNAGGLLDLDAMRDLEKRVYNLSDVNDFIEIGKQTGNKVSVPFQVGGPKMTVDEIEALEAAHKFSPAKEGYFEPKIFTPEDFEIGSLIIPNPGDPTAAGRLIQSASGPSNVVNVSGTDFMRQIGDGEGNPAIWASGPSVMTKLQNRGLLADGNPAYFVSSEQGAESVLFNTVAAERYEELFDPSKISKKGATEIRKALERRTKDKEGNLAPIAKWQENIPDPSSPKFAKWLHSLPGTTKSEVIQRLNKDKIISEGAPDVREIIHSVTAPENVWALDKDAAWAKNLANDTVPGLLYDPLVGKSIARVDPGVPLRPSTNPSFPTETTGEYVGGFGFRPTRSQVWRDWYAGKNLANKPVNAAHRGFTLSYPVQMVDAEWQDTLMKLREEAMRQK